MVKKNKKVPWYKKIKSPISIELSFEDGNFNIGASVDIGPFGIEISTFDGGTFGLGVGVFDIEVEGDGSGKIGMLFDTFKMVATVEGCSIIKKTYFQDFLYHTEAQKIEGCKTDEEKEREENEEEEDNEDIDEDINEDEEEENEDENEEEENDEEENKNEEENDEEESEDEEEDDEEEDDEESDDKNNDDEKNKHKTWNNTLEFDINYPTTLDGLDIKQFPACNRVQIEIPNKPLYLEGDQDQVTLALISFIDVRQHRWFDKVWRGGERGYQIYQRYNTHYQYFKFLEIKSIKRFLSSKPFPLFLTSKENETVKSKSFLEPEFSRIYNSSDTFFLMHVFSFVFFHNKTTIIPSCQYRQEISNPYSTSSVPYYYPYIMTKEKYKEQNRTSFSSPERKDIWAVLSGYYSVSLEGGTFPLLKKPFYFGGLDREYLGREGERYSYHLPFPMFLFGTRKDINRRLKEGYDNGSYNHEFEKRVLPTNTLINPFGTVTPDDIGLEVPDGGFYTSFARTARLVFEIPQKPFDFDIIPPMETEKCCFTPDDREALMFNQRALKDLSTALGVQPRPKSGNNGPQNAEQEKEAAKNAVGFPLPVYDISNPKAIQNGRNTRYSKVIEEHDKINVGNYRELLLEILKLTQEQSMGLGLPKLRKHGFGVPKNAMEPTTDTSPDRAYDLVGIFARMFAAIIENGIPGPINLITKKGKEIIESQVYTNKEYFETLFALVAENLQVTRRNQITVIKLAQLNTTLHKISLITYRFIRHVLIPGLGIPFKRSANPDESVKHGQYNSYFTPFNFSNIIQKGFGGANSDEGIEMNPNFKPKTEDIDQTHDEANVPGNGYLSSVFFPGKTANLWMQIKALMKKST